MTTKASKFGLRKAAQERTSRHAQRTPLPPRAGQVEAASEPVEGQEYGKMTQPELRRAAKKLGIQSTMDAPKGKLLSAILAKEKQLAAARADEKPAKKKAEPEPKTKAIKDSKSWPKAEAVMKAVEPHGWTCEHEVHDGDNIEVTAVRGDEVLWISWTAGVLTSSPMPTYTIADRTVKLRNASALKQYASRKPEAGVKELEKVRSNTFFRKKPTEPKKHKLPFDPATATDTEVIDALLGKAVAWHNSLSQNSEAAQIGRNPRKVSIAEHQGDRIVKFCCPETGFRAFRLSALTKVGGRRGSGKYATVEVDA